jgi:hypothetical protein
MYRNNCGKDERGKEEIKKIARKNERKKYKDRKKEKELRSR